MKLKIEVSTWSGWAKEDYVPEVKIFGLECKKGKSLNLNSFFMPNKVTIKEVNENSVKIYLKDALTFGSRLNWQHDFEIKIGEVLRVETPSFDAGVLYKFSLA